LNRVYVRFGLGVGTGTDLFICIKKSLKLWNGQGFSSRSFVLLRELNHHMSAKNMAWGPLEIVKKICSLLTISLHHHHEVPC